MDRAERAAGLGALAGGVAALAAGTGLLSLRHDPRWARDLGDLAVHAQLMLVVGTVALAGALLGLCAGTRRPAAFAGALMLTAMLATPALVAGARLGPVAAGLVAICAPLVGVPLGARLGRGTV
ncbi:MAG: hypothetical protein IT200_08750 [Thermoleophilia bacterium]|nr:hypothetical protein [Thermoleophilia bacterium]